MNRRISKLLVVFVVLFLLSGCSALEAWEKIWDPKEPATGSIKPDPSPPEESTNTPVPQPTENEKDLTSDPLDFTDEDALKSVLEGEWVYCPPASDSPAAWITFSTDGEFHVRLKDPQDGAVLEDTGVYHLDWWETEKEEAPDMICLEFTEDSSGPISNKTSSAGDHLIRLKTLCDGEVLLGLMQLNNGDSMFSLYFSDTAPFLRRYTGWQPQEEIRKSETFCAQAWKVDYETQTVWLDDINEGFDNIGRYEALPYQAASQMDLTSLPSQVLVDGGIWLVRTDEKGQIFEMIPHVFEIDDEYDELEGFTEEEAAMLLSEVQEVQEYLEQGMTMFFDGVTEIEDEPCIMISLGRADEEIFVSEFSYAVSPTGRIYFYDASTYSWNIVDME
ncbi:hypothetical protein [Massiliimalia massiliensis]|uniref:hypothetical protein n=1 Tax=Massiliimalia massiliensis TaxID=1852384 RepID=UPI00117BCBD6|nr:hypothetical protein [Massiliimalia massiliensis]